MKSEHYQGLGTACQQAEIGMFLGKVTSGMMASWNWAEYVHPTPRVSENRYHKRGRDSIGIGLGH